jgi:tetratricopeptide (TPR) repeat protein
MDTASIAALLTTALTPVLPYLLKGGEKAIEEAGKQLGGEAWEKSRTIWAKLFPSVKEQPDILLAAEAAANAPNDILVRDDLNSKLKRLLDNDPELALILRRAFTPAVYQLYAPVEDFVGREAEIERLIFELGSGQSVSICGMSGSGKTQLAMLVANRVRHLYPDGQLFVAMQGTADIPRDPAEALEVCTRAFVGPEESLPKNVDEMRGRFFNVLTDKRVLIVLDNAASSKQVRPLQPPPGCALLVTSINIIALPGLRCRVLINEFTRSEACELLLKMREMDPAIADRIAALCGDMPLAIRAAGSFLDVTGTDPVNYAKQLADEQTRLGLINQEDIEDVSVAAAFNVSYRRLNPESARVFSKLAVFQSSFDGDAEEYVCEDPNQRHLCDLERQSLVLSADIFDKTKRYRLQHLGRLFANEHLAAEDRYVSAKRHAEHYQKLLRKASQMYEQGGDSLRQALKLFDKERDNVRTGRLWAEHNCESNPEAAELSVRYSVVGECFFSLRWPANERLQSLKISLSCAQGLGQRDAEGNLLGSIGRVFVEAGDFLRASKQFAQQLVVARETGNRTEEGHALNSLGDSYLRLDQPRAVELYEEALAISRAISDRQNEGRALNNLGDAYRNSGEFARAADFYKQQLEIAKEIGDVRGEGNALNNLGESFNNLGEIRRAIEYHEQALVIAEEIGTRLGRANVLNNLGNAYLATGAAHRAMTFYEQALAISNEIGYSHGENMTLANLAEACISAGHYHRAIECLSKAFTFFEQNGSRRGQGNVLNNLGKAHYALGEYQQALELNKKALIIAREIGSKHGEAHVLNDMGECYVALGERSRAIELLEQVLNSFRIIGDLRGVSNTLNSLGRAYQQAGSVGSALEFYQEAVKIARDTCDQSAEAGALFDMALALDQLGDRDEAISQANLALRLYEKLEHHRVRLVREQLTEWA